MIEHKNYKNDSRKGIRITINTANVNLEKDVSSNECLYISHIVLNVSSLDKVKSLFLREENQNRLYDTINQLNKYLFNIIFFDKYIQC